MWDGTQRRLVVTDVSVNPSVPSSRIKQPKKTSPICCPETSIPKYQTCLKTSQKREDLIVEILENFKDSKNTLFPLLFAVWATHYRPNYTEIRGACLYKFHKHTIVGYIFPLLFIILTHVPQIL